MQQVKESFTRVVDRLSRMITATETLRYLKVKRGELSRDDTLQFLSDHYPALSYEDRCEVWRQYETRASGHVVIQGDATNA